VQFLRHINATQGKHIQVCVVREEENVEFMLLTPCGDCQERLFYWGEDVKVTVTNSNKGVIFKTSREFQPYHWYKAYD